MDHVGWIRLRVKGNIHATAHSSKRRSIICCPSYTTGCGSTRVFDWGLVRIDLPIVLEVTLSA
jgi:hypothetical protein